MITRGTTPYHNFILPVLAEEIEELYVTYCQNEDNLFEKNLESEGVSIENLSDKYENASVENLPEEEFELSSELTIHLTQEDTLKFTFYPAAEKNIATINIRLLTVDKEAYASEPIKERIFGIRKEGVIGNGEG